MDNIFYSTGYDNPNFTLDLRNCNFSSVYYTNGSSLQTNNTSHKMYVNDANKGFFVSRGFTGTIINCTTTPASCP